jgi:hypothetical protein
MKRCVRFLNGVKRAAIRRVEATTARVDFWPVRATKVLCITTNAVYIVCDERGGAEKMKVEILYFDGCPTYLRAEETLRGVLAREGVEADEILVPVKQD